MALLDMIKKWFGGGEKEGVSQEAPAEEAQESTTEEVVEETVEEVVEEAPAEETTEGEEKKY